MPAIAGKRQQQRFQEQHATGSTGTPTIVRTLGPSATLSAEMTTTEKTIIATLITPASAGMPETAGPPTTAGSLTRTRTPIAGAPKNHLQKTPRLKA